ncbi:hypothetical protein [Nocardioides antri]|uniref:hypothetical protein n=1 Tax=Nocardioides antri TaxID=2607659 RepID=UPI00165FC5FB|nr:hypothetical protein [Nocardioides antri]
MAEYATRIIDCPRCGKEMTVTDKVVFDSGDGDKVWATVRAECVSLCTGIEDHEIPRRQ